MAWLWNYVQILETPTLAEEKKLASWGYEVPGDFVLDEKNFAEALNKVKFPNLISFCDLSSYPFWCKYFGLIKRLNCKLDFYEAKCTIYLLYKKHHYDGLEQTYTSLFLLCTLRVGNPNLIV